MSERTVSIADERKRRAWRVVDLALYLSGLAVLALVVNVFAQRDGLRNRIDATKTRAYSLSEQTRELLLGLKGDWTIALFMVEQDADRATRRQVDEVLERFTEVAPSIEVLRIDPTDPRSLQELEQMLSRLRALYADLVAQYETSLDYGVEMFETLQLFAQQESAGLEQITRMMPADGAERENLLRWVQLLSLLAQQGDAVLAEVEKARRVDGSRPLPDYETARSILAETLGQWAQELYDLSQVFDRWFDDPGVSSELRRAASTAGRAFERQAQELALAADPLKQLPPLELSEIARQIQQGDAAIVIGNGRAASIPSQQLFPRTNVRSTGAGSVSFDQRFRGEQLIASAVRSLLVEQMPTVVFVHSEPRSLLRSHDRDVDLIGVASMLQASKFDVREWIVHQGERPEPDPGRPVVYVVVPPTQRSGLEPTAEEQSLVSAVGRLVQEGRPMLLSFHPSIWTRYRRRDPWTTVAAAYGVEAETSQVIYEAVRVSEDDVQVERGQIVNDYPESSPVSRALQGQQSYLAVPIPLRASGDAAAGTTYQPVARVEPSADRWLEREWDLPLERAQRPGDDARLTNAVDVAVAVERPNPTTREMQRAVLVGSGGWMMSYVADVAVNVGGERFALLYPGNHELMLASVAWLAGMDELIAPSPASQEIGRMAGISDGARRRLSALSLGVLPGAWLVLGLTVWWWRRR